MPSADLGPGPVLVTGASGFIGSAVVRALVDEGYEVRALVEPGRDDANLDGLPIERIDGDIRDPATLDRAVDGVSTRCSTWPRCTASGPRIPTSSTT